MARVRVALARLVELVLSIGILVLALISYPATFAVCRTRGCEEDLEEDW